MSIARDFSNIISIVSSPFLWMLELYMAFAGVRLGECLVTKLADEGLRASVHTLMRLEVRFLIQNYVTLVVLAYVVFRPTVCFIIINLEAFVI